MKGWWTFPAYMWLRKISRWPWCFESSWDVAKDPGPGLKLFLLSKRIERGEAESKDGREGTRKITFD